MDSAPAVAIVPGLDPVGSGIATSSNSSHRTSRDSCATGEQVSRVSNRRIGAAVNSAHSSNSRLPNQANIVAVHPTPANMYGMQVTGQLQQPHVLAHLHAIEQVEKLGSLQVAHSRARSQPDTSNLIRLPPFDPHSAKQEKNKSKMGMAPPQRTCDQSSYLPSNTQSTLGGGTTPTTRAKTMHIGQVFDAQGRPIAPSQAAVRSRTDMLRSPEAPLTSPSAGLSEPCSRTNSLIRSAGPNNLPNPETASQQGATEQSNCASPNTVRSNRAHSHPYPPPTQSAQQMPSAASAMLVNVPNASQAADAQSGAFRHKHPSMPLAASQQPALTQALRPEVTVGSTLVALFEFRAREMGDLDMVKGDKLVLRNIHDHDWWLVEKVTTHEEGYVPATFVAPEGSLAAEDWYHGPLSRKEAERLLLLPGTAVGTYLVRDSETTPGAFSLSVLDNDSNKGDNIKHYRILSQRSRDQHLQYYFETRNTKYFENLYTLLAHYYLKKDGLCCQLKVPCAKRMPTTVDLCRRTRDKWEIPRSELELMSVIGRGQFGQVWLAKWRSRTRPPLPPSPQAPDSPTSPQPPAFPLPPPVFAPGAHQSEQSFGNGHGQSSSGNQSSTFSSHTSTSEPDAVLVAVKELRPEGGMTSESFHEEAGIMKKLRHQNLVALLAVCNEGIDENGQRLHPYIITEYMCQGSVIHYLKEGSGRYIRLPALVDLLAQVASGMAYLESKKFVHRDLAARNILVCEQNVAKIADFGLARLLRENEYSARQGAKFPIKWTAPEAALSGIFNSKSDVWSFGIVIFEVITRGGTPYAEMSNRETLEAVSNGYRLPRPVTPQAPLVCPEELYDLMNKCWLAEAEKRPTFDYLATFLNEYYEATEPNYRDESVSKKSTPSKGSSSKAANAASTSVVAPNSNRISPSASLAPQQPSAFSSAHSHPFAHSQALHGVHGIVPRTGPAPAAGPQVPAGQAPVLPVNIINPVLINMPSAHGGAPTQIIVPAAQLAGLSAMSNVSNASSIPMPVSSMTNQPSALFMMGLTGISGSTSSLSVAAAAAALNPRLQTGLVQVPIGASVPVQLTYQAVPAMNQNSILHPNQIRDSNQMSSTRFSENGSNDLSHSNNCTQSNSDDHDDSVVSV